MECAAIAVLAALVSAEASAMWQVVVQLPDYSSLDIACHPRHIHLSHHLGHKNLIIQGFAQPLAGNPDTHHADLRVRL
jgi:hypothetical protein